ncbi:MAG: ABC transporter [Microbacterium sp.]|uniref:ABC transporter n=1 Tax=Microbacterium sp. TaxID=51671 RepID=UPI0039E47D27
MSDPNTTPEDTSLDEAVARANEGLADAEAAGRDAVADPTPADVPAVEPVVAEPVAEATASEPAAEPVVAEPVEPAAVEPAVVEPVAEPVVAEPVAETPVVLEEPVVAEPAAWYDRPEEEAAPAASEPVVAPADTFVATTVAAPIFVQAPEAPRPRGNRGAAGAIGLLAAVTFAVITFGIQFGAAFVLGSVDGAHAVSFATALATSWVFWVPVVAFFIGFWFLGAILNRARWGHWVIWGLLVAAVAYGGYILGVLFEAPFWQLTASQGRSLLADSWFAPFAIVAFVVAREVAIWFGAWVAARGRKVTELNEVAQAEYERTLEAGPQLYQQ